MKRIMFLSLILLFAMHLPVMAEGPATPDSTAFDAVSSSEHNVMATLWMQTSAEYRALCYQAFNVAQVQLERALANREADKKYAVIVDIDETVLDNSPYQAMLILENTSYPDGWAGWMDLGQAEAVPGAIDFLNMADSLGVDVFYVSNRRISGLEGTLKNLQELGFPQAVESHLYLRIDDSSKESRREAIDRTHEIVLLMGDNLNDFAMAFEEKSVADRLAAVDRTKDAFGHRFIVLPNPTYGEWEGAVYDYNWRLPDSEKNQLRKSHLRGY